MRIFGIDPGYTIGVAWYDPDSKDFGAMQTKWPQMARLWLQENVTAHAELNVFLVEDYLSAGHLTKEAKHTVKLVGFFEHYLEYNWSTVKLVPPQKRLSGVSQAVKWASERGIEGPHSWDALAHAIVAAREF